MNPEELGRSLAKFKSKRIKLRLATFCLLIALFLSLSTLGAGVSQSSLISFLLILPLPLYFALQRSKLSRQTKRLRARLRGLEGEVVTEAHFSLAQFLLQPNWSFRLSLLLLLLVTLTTLARLRAPTPTLSYQTTTNR